MFSHWCKWSLLLIYILLLWSFYSAAGEVWGDRTERQKIISTIKTRLLILPLVLFLVFQESITMLPGLQPTTWFAAKSSKFAKFASGTPVGFEDQPVYWTQSSKQNLQQQNISIRHLKTRPTQPGIISKPCSAIHKKDETRNVNLICFYTNLTKTAEMNESFFGVSCNIYLSPTGGH